MSICTSTWEGSSGPCILTGEHSVHEDGMGAKWANGATPRREDFMIYAARAEGWPGYVAVMVDDPAFKNDTARELAAWVRKGYTIERVTREQSVAGLQEYLDERKRRKAAAAEAKQDNTQIGMFA